MATMSARYTVIDGEVIAQERGGVRHQLVPDPLGSTVALYDDSGTKTDTFSYWPYGESSGRTGTTTVKFQYVGSYGYYQDNSTKNYVRVRYLDGSRGRWISQDSGFIDKYTYAFINPVSFGDPILNPDQNNQRKLGLPEELEKGCLSKSAKKALLEKLKDPCCASEILSATGGIDGLSALNNGKIAPTFVFPDICNPIYGKKPGGQCRTILIPFPPDSGSVNPSFCEVKNICINKAACKSSPEQTACMVLFELGNAIQCYMQLSASQSKEDESVAERISIACSCGRIVQGKGVTIGR